MEDKKNLTMEEELKEDNRILQEKLEITQAVVDEIALGGVM